MAKKKAATKKKPSGAAKKSGAKKKAGGKKKAAAKKRVAGKGKRPARAAKKASPAKKASSTAVARSRKPANPKMTVTIEKPKPGELVVTEPIGGSIQVHHTVHEGAAETPIPGKSYDDLNRLGAGTHQMSVEGNTGGGG